MKKMSTHQWWILVLITVAPIFMCILQVATNRFEPQNALISVVATVERDVITLVVRLPSNNGGEKTDLTFFDNNPALGNLAGEVTIGPANGTATSFEDYKRTRLSDDNWNTVQNIATQWCRKGPAESSSFSSGLDNKFYEIGVDCDGFRSAHFFLPDDTSSVELKTLLSFAP